MFHYCANIWCIVSMMNWRWKEEIDEEKEQHKITIYLSLNYVFQLKWYNFDIIFYEHRLNK